MLLIAPPVVSDNETAVELRPVALVRAVAKYPADVVAWARLMYLVRRLKPDVLHGHGGEATRVAQPLAEIGTRRSQSGPKTLIISDITADEVEQELSGKLQTHKQKPYVVVLPNKTKM